MGFLDPALRAISAQLTGLFTSSPATWTQEKAVYDSVSATDTVIERTVRVNATPPVPVTRKLVEDVPGLIGTELVTYAAQVDFDDLSPAFDPRPRKDVRVHVEFGGRAYEVMWVREYYSGDQVALLEFMLRS